MSFWTLNIWQRLHITLKPTAKLSTSKEQSWRIFDVLLGSIQPNGTRMYNTWCKHSLHKSIDRRVRKPLAEFCLVNHQAQQWKSFLLLGLVVNDWLDLTSAISDDMTVPSDSIYLQNTFCHQIEGIGNKTDANPETAKACYKGRLDKNLRLTTQVHLRQKLFVDRSPAQMAASLHVMNTPITKSLPKNIRTFGSIQVATNTVTVNDNGIHNWISVNRVTLDLATPDILTEMTKIATHPGRSTTGMRTETTNIMTFQVLNYSMKGDETEGNETHICGEWPVPCIIKHVWAGKKEICYRMVRIQPRYGQSRADKPQSTTFFASYWRGLNIQEISNPRNWCEGTVKQKGSTDKIR